MKIARYALEDQVFHGLLRSDGMLERLEGSAFETPVRAGKTDPLSEVRLLAPVAAPRVFGVGLNYRAHAEESGKPVPEFPMLFMKPDSAVVGPGDPIVYPREGRRVDYECELAVVIGKSARRVSPAQALDVVLGYTCANDISERPIQWAEMAMGCLLIGKGYDSFCPLGPWIETEVDPGALDISTRVNGRMLQHSNTSDLIFGVPELVAYLSRAITLRPGDVIITGTPAGIGPLQPGDHVEIEIEGIGVLANPVVAEA
jgi:2-keto-4-pentenoate hydratase/2-oxohepta-3-ene-1,7-dioic acid hydratase in catechol pathway